MSDPTNPHGGLASAPTPPPPHRSPGFQLLRPRVCKAEAGAVQFLSLSADVLRGENSPERWAPLCGVLLLLLPGHLLAGLAQGLAAFP